jgi:hypothetical protein
LSSGIPSQLQLVKGYGNDMLQRVPQSPNRANQLSNQDIETVKDPIRTVLMTEAERANARVDKV